MEVGRLGDRSDTNAHSQQPASSCKLRAAILIVTIGDVGGELVGRPLGRRLGLGETLVSRSLSLLRGRSAARPQGRALPASSMASAKVFATVNLSWYWAGALRSGAAVNRCAVACGHPRPALRAAAPKTKVA